MNSSIFMPKHFFVSHGQLVEKNNADIRSSPPKIVDYVHTIRILSNNNSDHQQMIQGIHNSYRQKLLEKDRQIEDLSRIIQSRDEEIKKKNEEIEKYQQKLREVREVKLELSVIQPHLERSILVETNKLQISSIMNQTQFPKQNQFYGEFSRQKEFEEDNEQILKIKKQMKSTQQALSSITNLLQKPKKKYQFFNSNLKQNKSQLQSPCVSSKLDNSNFRNKTFISNKKQPTPFCQMDLSMTKTDQSRDTFDFIPQTANQDPVVSSFLAHWQPTVKQEITMIKQHDDEVKTSITLLDNQNEKKQLNILNSSIVDQLMEDQGPNLEKQDMNNCKYLEQMRFLFNSEEVSL